MKPFISIIIPVYNVEKYLLNCLESINRQSFSDYEVLLINDGSTDASSEIAGKYIQENKLDNFFVITKENGGPSSARNMGLDRANGEWIYFIDSDDWMEPEALATLSDYAKKYQPDLVLGGYQAVRDEDGTEETWNKYPKEYGVLPQDFDGLHSFSFVYGRLYKKAIIDAHSIRFDERIKYAEDNAFQFDYNCYVNSYAATNRVLYSYRINRPGALTQKVVSPKVKKYVWEHLVNFVEKYDEKVLENALFSSVRFNHVFWGTTSTAVVNNILEKNIKEAKRIRDLPLSKAAVDAYEPRSQKDKIFMCLWKRSFFFLRLFVVLYYKNFEKLRRSKLLEKLSKMG